MDEDVNRTCISGVLSVISVQAPGIHRNTGGHLFSVSEHVVNRANAAKSAGWIVFQRIHHEVCSGSNTPCRGVTGPVAQYGGRNVGSVPSVGVGRRWIKPKLRIGRSDSSHQVGVVAVQSGICDGDHFTRTIERERGVVLHIGHARYRPRERIVNAMGSCRLCPHDSPVVGDVLNEVACVMRGEGYNAQPSIATRILATVANQIRGELCVATDGQIGCRQHQQALGGCWLVDENRCKTPSGMLHAQPPYVGMVTKVLFNRVC